jgi:uncharacterized protein (DUF1800 family)
MSLSMPTMSAIRFGYGIRPGEALPQTADDLLADLDKAKTSKLRFPAEGIDGRYATIRHFNEKIAAEYTKDTDARRLKMRPIRKEIFQICGVDQHARIVQSAFSPHGFHERLATFWVDHFSVNVSKQRMMHLYTPLYEAESLRPNMTGPFTTLLKAAILHPAMLVYLDQVKSMGPNSRRGQRTGRGLNENLGRELLELHTLGVDGGYTQEDVRAAATVLTGLTVDRKSGEMDFSRQMAEPGPLSFMGKTYGEKKRSVQEIDEMLTDICSMPQTGKHICRKLAVHFVSDKPPEELVAAMVDAWNKSDGNLRDVYAAMLHHPAAWDNQGEKARQPYDFVVAGLRALDVPEQALGMPKNHDAENEHEDNAPAKPANTMMPAPGKQREKVTELTDEQREDQEDRMDKKKRVKIHPPENPISVKAVAKLGQPVWQPQSPAGTEEAFNTWISSSQITGRIAWAQRVSAQFGGRESPNALLKAVLRDAARDDTIKVVSQAPNKTAGMALVLASPEFNRR